MEFSSRCNNAYREPTKRCENCGHPALHQARRDDFIIELCCDCMEKLSGDACVGHEIAGSESENGGKQIHIMTVTEEEINIIWNRISCMLHGICVPDCCQGSGSYGCCMLCDPGLSCEERCEGFAEKLP